ncbi:unnamed protein product [Kluyveromyces dobzhanskii CBS 2104]|uniref:WGS project CCBQ000000000 data, contig 00105 n=1 Tax=Kluyveromyces dobzhanskii CBS 2104 TaxID=1427455 RepID=A0A0A8L1F5_9SACH|nr:unnamed protein product [Kluyveromyces dobzhanskii CBS 2104]
MVTGGFDGGLDIMVINTPASTSSTEHITVMIGSVTSELLANHRTGNEDPTQNYNMVQCVGHISTLNQTLLNKITAEIVQSMLKPTLEFDEILMESFMYPRGMESLLHKYRFENTDDMKERDCDFDIQDIGHAQILEIVHLRRIILDTQSKCKRPDQPDFIQHVQQSLHSVESLMYDLLKRLSVYMEVPSCSRLYNGILSKQLPNFKEFFLRFKTFHTITNSLFETAMKTGQNPSKYFNVEITLSDTITKFMNSNEKWMHQMLLESSSLQEFRMTLSGNDKIDESTLQPSSKVTRSSSFKKFNQERKNRLRISHRSL